MNSTTPQNFVSTLRHLAATLSLCAMAWLASPNQASAQWAHAADLQTPVNTLVGASDGLSSRVETVEILTIAPTATPDRACQKLGQLARDRRGPDNLSVQVARVEARG